MKALPILLSEIFQFDTEESRRHFLLRGSALFVSATMIAALRRTVLTAEEDARINAHWKRINRGLPRKTMDAYRMVATKLAPRMESLLMGSNWEGEAFGAIVKELKLSGAYPDHQPPLDPVCAKSEESRLRGEAGSNSRGTPGAVKAASNTAAAVVATLPNVGPIIAAILVAIAAVMMLIAQIIARSRESEKAKSEKRGESNEDPFARVRKLELRLLTTMEGLDDCLLFGKKLS